MRLGKLVTLLSLPADQPTLKPSVICVFLLSLSSPCLLILLEEQVHFIPSGSFHSQQAVVALLSFGQSGLGAGDPE